MFPFGKDSEDKKEKREPNGWDIMSVVINLIRVCSLTINLRIKREKTCCCYCY